MTQTRQGRAQACDNRIRATRKDLLTNMRYLGDDLLEMKRYKLYQELGFTSMASYVQDRVGISLATAMRRITIARKLDEIGAPNDLQVRETAVMAILQNKKVMADSKVALEWLQKAQHMTVQKLKYELAKATGLSIRCQQEAFLITKREQGDVRKALKILEKRGLTKGEALATIARRFTSEVNL